MSSSSTPLSVSAATTPSKVTPTQEWRKDNILISTSHSLLNLTAINDAFASPELSWTKRMQPSRLQKMLNLSMCFGVYEIPLPSQSTSSTSTFIDTNTNKHQIKQIGLARLVTDTTTFAYLNDVYILPSHQHKGLATFLMSCVHSTVMSWPDLRRVCLFSESVEARNFYLKTLGMQSFILRGGNKIGRAEDGENEEGIEYLMMPQTKDLSGYEFLTTTPASVASVADAEG